MDDSYMATVPPEPLGDQDKVEVTVDVDVLSVLDISEVDGFVTLQLTVRLTW